MTARILITLNAIGCLLLAGLVAVQWKRERDLNAVLEERGNHIISLQQALGVERDRSLDLEGELEGLKEVLQRLKADFEEKQKQIGIQRALIERQQAALDEANGQLDAWEQALGERDARIELLNEQLLATRKRLDEAVERLNSSD